MGVGCRRLADPAHQEAELLYAIADDPDKVLVAGAAEGGHRDVDVESGSTRRVSTHAPSARPSILTPLRIWPYVQCLLWRFDEGIPGQSPRRAPTGRRNHDDQSAGITGCGLWQTMAHFSWVASYHETRWVARAGCAAAASALKSPALSRDTARRAIGDRKMSLIDTIGRIKAALAKNLNLTEADSRAQIIDPLLRDLNWPDEQTKREPYAGWADHKGFIDYLLMVRNKPLMVVEAKKVGRQFDIPALLAKQKQTTYEKLFATASSDLREALQQCVRYATHCGATFSCATNGADFVFFKSHHGSRPLPQAKCILFVGWDDVLQRLDEFMDLFDRPAFEHGRAERLLVGKEMEAPSHARRLVQTLPPPPDPSLESAEYSKLLELILRNYIVDVRDEATFLACYIDVDVNRTTNSMLDAILANQENHVSAKVPPDRFATALTAQLSLPEAPVGKTVLLHGAIGVGKSSFVRTLYARNSAKESLWVVVDLIDFKDHPFDAKVAGEMAALLGRRVRDRVSEEAEKLGRRNADPDEWNHLRDIYNAEVRAFQKGKFPGSDDSDSRFIEQVRDYVWKLREADPQDHLVRTLRWLTGHCKIPVVLILDNSDQLGLEFQEFLFKLAESAQTRSSAITVLALRTEALVSHRLRAHALATVVEKYEIRRPSLVEVLKRRFEVVIERLHGLATPDEAYRVATERLEALMDTLLEDARSGGEAASIIEALGNGNLRRALQGLASVFRPDQKVMDSLVAAHGTRRRATLPARYLRRSILNGTGSRYNSDDPDCLIPNVYQGETSLKTPHTLPIRVLQHLDHRAFGGEAPTVGEIASDFSMAGVDREFIWRLIARMRRQQLVAVPHMNKDVGDSDGVRLTVLGTSMLRDWFRDQEYLKAAAFDTVIYDERVYTSMVSSWRDHRIPAATRFAVIENTFVDYLLEDDRRLREGLNLDLLSPVVREALALKATGAAGRSTGASVPAPAGNRHRRRRRT